jgi:hypothetical protein
MPRTAAADEFEQGMMRKLFTAAALFAAVAIFSRLLAASLGVVLYLAVGCLLLAACAAVMERARR